jgi:release factor glutamine methyltransferase
VATVRELFLQAAGRLGNGEGAALEARLLLERCTRLGPEKLLAGPDRPVSPRAAAQLEKLVARRASGVPLAYVLGAREFWSLSFRVGPGVLIPRPETEIVVEQVLKLVSSPAGAILDVGTGSGNIALSLARELPGFKVLALDVSRRAVARSRANAARLGLERVEIIQSSLFHRLKGRGLEGSFDFIVSNPPYVAEAEWAALDESIRRHEPKRALVPGPTGLELIERLVKRSPRYLKPDGFLVFEIGAGQDTRVLDLFDKRWKGVERVLDLAGIPRVVIAQYRGRPGRRRKPA